MPRSVVLRIGACLLLVACLLPVGAVAAESPVPSAAASGDVRTGGEGAGLVGSPFLAAAGVIVVGLAAAGLTVAWVRLERRRLPRG